MSQLEWMYLIEELVRFILTPIIVKEEKLCSVHIQFCLRRKDFQNHRWIILDEVAVLVKGHGSKSSNIQKSLGYNFL